MKAALIDPPANDEIEISIFGRGYGESLCIHLTDGQWAVVDSLRDSDGTPAPLAYLRALGVALEQDVKLIVATHWHDDHIQGLAQVYEACTAARIVFSIAMLKDEFHAYFSRHENVVHAKLSSGVAELQRIAQLRDARPPPILASSHKVLWRDEQRRTEIEALSPSDADVSAFMRSIAQRLAAGERSAERAVPFDRNDASVVLAVRAGQVAALLGRPQTRHADGQLFLILPRSGKDAPTTSRSHTTVQGMRITIAFGRRCSRSDRLLLSALGTDRPNCRRGKTYRACLR